MDEILALQAELERVQQQETVLRLSDRNVVELILKLKSLDKVVLLYSIDGKQFITPPHLRREVEDEITAAGGRVRLDQVSINLNVEQIHVHRAMRDIVREDDEVEFLEGEVEVVTSWYLDGIADELNEALSEAGQLTLGEMAQRYDLPVNVVKIMITNRLGTRIRAELSGGVLYTEAHVKRQRAQIRGLLSAVARPTSVPKLAQQHGFEVKVVQIALSSMLADGQLAGKLSGGQYVPSVYAAVQRSGVEDFVRSNCYIQHDMLRKMQVQSAAKFIRASFEDALELDSLFVRGEALQALDDAIDECVANGTWLNVLGGGGGDGVSVLPSVATEADAIALLAKARVSQRRSAVRARLVASSFVVTDRMMERLVELARERAKSAATSAAAKARLKGQRSASLSVSSAQTADIKPHAGASAGGGAKGVKKKGKRGGRRRGDDEDEPQPSHARGGGKGRKGKKGKGRGRRGGDSDDDNDERASSSAGAGGGGGAHSQSATIEVPGNLSTASLSALVAQEYPGTAAHEELLDTLGAQLHSASLPVFRAAVDEALASVVHGEAAARRAKLARRDHATALNSLLL